MVLGGRSRVLLLLFPLAMHCVLAQGANLRGEAQLLQSKPDISLVGDFEFDARPAIVDALLTSPMIVARLWEAHGFTPRYMARLQGEGIHVVDPTGIEGDLYLAEQTGSRRVWVGFGSLNHRLVPSFKGRMALVLTTKPKGSKVSAHLAVFVRADNRALGFLASTFFPLVKARIQHRVAANAADVGAILAEVSADPQRAAARLSHADAAALLRAIGASAASK
jgi:hypothetical protein